MPENRSANGQAVTCLTQGVDAVARLADGRDRDLSRHLSHPTDRPPVRSGMEAPYLGMTAAQTPRLILREVTLDDLPRIEKIYTDPAGMAFKGGPRTRESIRKMVEGTIRFYEAFGYGRWGVILKTEERLIGWCGLMHQEVEGTEEIEVSYHLDRPYWGRGLATEAARAVKEYGFNTLGLKRLISLIDPGNAASRKVALKNGMQLEKEVMWKNRPTQVYAMGPPRA